MLVGGHGPVLPCGALCPGCEGQLGRWGSYRRWVRRAGEVLPLRVRRAICRSCGATHAVLPSFLYGRRLDLAEVIFGGLVAGARGRGHRRVAAAARVPQTTARGWLRRARRDADRRRAYFAGLATELGAISARPPPHGCALGLLVEAIGEARRAAAERFGAAAVGSLGSFSAAACRGSAAGQHEPALCGPAQRGQGRGRHPERVPEGGHR